jgi:alcohol dehydrogenase class IV
MVNDFVFTRNPEIYFGTGKVTLLPSLVRRFGKSLLLVTGARSFTESGTFLELSAKLKEQQVRFRHVKIASEPSPQLIDVIVGEHLLQDTDCVVAIGGGSVLDAGKAIAAMLTQDGFVQEFMEGIGTGRLHPGRRTPFIAVPTTAGTGSEATKNAVLSSVGTLGYKKSLRHDSFVPDIALVDPELTLSCPANLTASCGMDALTQLLESYVSGNSSPMTDSLCLSGLEHIEKGLWTAVHNGGDINARTSMSYAAMISGITLANAGLGTVHGFASVIGGYYDIPHGVICGTLMSAVVKANIKILSGSSHEHPALKKYAQAGRIFSRRQGLDREGYWTELITLLDRWTEDLRLPRLGHFGVQTADLEKIIAETDQKNNPVILPDEILLDILTARI